MFVNEWVDDGIVWASHNARGCEGRKMNTRPKLNRDCNQVRERRHEHPFFKTNGMGHHNVIHFTMRIQTTGKKGVFLIGLEENSCKKL